MIGPYALKWTSLGVSEACALGVSEACAHAPENASIFFSAKQQVEILGSNMCTILAAMVGQVL